MTVKTLCRKGPEPKPRFFFWDQQHNNLLRPIAIIRRVRQNCRDDRLTVSLNNMLDCLQRICDASDRGMQAYHVRERAKRGLSQDGDL
jgi:hypothetical protein